MGTDLEHGEAVLFHPTDLLSCQQCGKQFSRPSHLERHQLTHLPPLQKNLIPCPRCGRSFSRRDVLLRHMRATHESRPIAARSTRKSCFRCIAKKLRCERTQPCTACAASQSACEYSSPPSCAPELSTAQHDDERPTLTSSVGLSDLGQSTTATWFPKPSNGLPDAGASFAALEAVPTASPEFRTNGFDWLDFDMPGLTIESHHSQFYEQAPTNRLSSWPELVHVQEVSHRQGMPQAIELQPATSLSWPFDHAPDTTSHGNNLPALKDVLEKGRSSTHSAKDVRLDNLLQLLSRQRLPALGSLQGSSAAEAFGDIQRLLDIYFSRFHDIQAIIHKPTWDQASCPTVLLTAMACVGALLSDEPRDTEFATALSDICMPTALWMGASDARHYHDISYLNALCLHQIYSLGSGNRQLYQSADRSRGALVGGLRGIGLLNSGWTTTASNDGQTRIDTVSDDEQQSSSTLIREWRAWIMREQELRAAWAAFEYDCSLCTLTSRRGVVDLGELPKQLPCLESLWDATSAQAWLALRSRLDKATLSPRLSVALEAAKKQQPPLKLGSWAKRLSAQVVGRLLWDLKQLEVVTMPEHLGLLSSLQAAHDESKQELLGTLRTLFALTADPLSTSDLITYNITGLLCHYSHLYAAGDVMDVALYIVRGIISPADSQVESLGLARDKLRSIFAQNAKAGRTLVWHAAQIVTIANEYLVSAPCEIMRVFMGYVFIMAYSAYGPRASSQLGYHAVVAVRLDLSDRVPQQKRAVADWIRCGGPAGVGSVVDIGAGDCLSCISRDAQSIMQKLKCWGLAGKFAKILYILGERGL